jgi:tRNA A37 N6-isopentenylltransferase MiaA
MEERKQVPHHLMEFVDPKDLFSVLEFEKEALKKVNTFSMYRYLINMLI